MSFVFQSVPTSQEKLKQQYDNMITLIPPPSPTKEDQILSKLSRLERYIWRLETMLKQLTDKKDTF